MAFQVPIETYGSMAEPVHVSTFMEPETVRHDSDDDVDTGGSPSTSSSKRDPGMLKRAMSSPSVRGLGVEGLSMSAADKKRNKLGYHRTAVACGHCRRRKIRCIPAFEDASGRCQNCIRLKKDCHFFPVDQQNVPSGRRARTSSKTDAAREGDMSASSSERGASSILKSSTDDTMKHVNGQMRSPLSPQETARFPSYDYARPNEYRGLPSQYDREQQGSQYLHHSSSMPPPPLYTGSEHAGTHGYPSLSSTMVTSPINSSPQSAAYASHGPSSGSDYGWQSQDARSNESYPSYGTHRAHSYPTAIRRASEPQNLPYGPGEPSGYLNPMQGRQYPDPSQYHPMGVPGNMQSRIPQMAIPASSSYTQSWYAAQGMPYVREEEDHAQAHAHGGQSQGYGRTHG